MLGNLPSAVFPSSLNLNDSTKSRASVAVDEQHFQRMMIFKHWEQICRLSDDRRTGETNMGERVGGELRDGEELVLGDESLGAAVGDFTWREHSARAGRKRSKLDTMKDEAKN